MEQRKFDLEDRLVDYACDMIDVVEALPKTRAGNYIAGQLIKSCHSPAFNYGEVQAAESRNDPDSYRDGNCSKGAKRV